MIARHSLARAGLLGNPSDGYGGKTISLTVGQFRATVELLPTDLLTIRPSDDDLDEFASYQELARSIELQGLYGGVRLLKATLKQFYDYCQDKFLLQDRNFSISYQTNIPRGVGLAGSSAIVTAALKALVDFFNVKIEPSTLASLALAVETDVLRIPAGLQDRVIQMLEGVVFMDFSPEVMHDSAGLRIGQYESLPLQPPGPIYLAFDHRASQPTEVYHSDLRDRFEQGEPQVIQGMRQFAEMATRGRDAWLAGDAAEMNRLIDANFDLRQNLCRLPEFQVRMVETARSAGASAKFCGSGGAIVGMLGEESDYARLQQRLSDIGCQVLRPQIV